MKKRSIIFTLSAVLLIFAVYFLYGVNGEKEDIQSNSGKNSNLNFTLKDLNGKEVDFSQFKGKVLIIDIWDTWCPPCRMEIPEFIELYSEYKDKGFLMIGVAIGREGINSVKNFIKEYKINYDNYIFDEKLFKIFGRFRGIPTTYVIDKDGKLYKKYTGYTAKSVFENDIKKLLKSKVSD